MQLFRFDLATKKSILLTDGKSRNGMPVWSHRSGLIAFDSTRRGGHDGADRDLWVMNPQDPSSARLVSEVEGTWSIADWSADDTELLAVNSPAANTRTIAVASERENGGETQLSPDGHPQCGACPPTHLTGARYMCSAIATPKPFDSGAANWHRVRGNR